LLTCGFTDFEAETANPRVAITRQGFEFLPQVLRNAPNQSCKCPLSICGSLFLCVRVPRGRKQAGGISKREVFRKRSRRPPENTAFGLRFDLTEAIALMLA
jgi:hypothetical protein